MSCYKYWSKISEIAADLSKHEIGDLQKSSLDEIIPMLDAIEVIAHDQAIDFDSAKHILDDQKMNDALKLIRRFYVKVGTRLEAHNAHTILESADPRAKLESFHFYDRYVVLVGNEGHMANLTAGDRVVFIGGGPLPLTLILLHKFFGVKGTSIEMLPEIADLSRKVLAKLGLDSEITVVDGDETALSRLDYDAVMVAAFAEPKERVFRNVGDAVTRETKILYRTYSGMRAILYAPVSVDDLKGFEELELILPTGKVNNTSVMIRKCPEALVRSDAQDACANNPAAAGPSHR